MSKFRKILCVNFSVLILLTLVFIWGNSMLSIEKSAKESGKVYETIKPVLDAVFGKDKISHNLIRKMAHGTEFFVLGIEICALTCTIIKPKLKNFLLILPYGLIVAITDEVIQKFTGRGSRFTDVLIDYCGYVLSLIIFYLICLLIRKIKSNKKKTTN
ncbi:MAG: VanZ family protein [Clostridia bacterium]|nr:VanZ family protein [Clostridia bacterium]